MQIKHRFNPFKETGVKVPKENRPEAARAVANYVKEQILSFTGDGETSVQGGKWRRRITPEYAEQKDGPDFANMENSGEMLDSLEVDADGEFVEISIPDEEAGKAEGNLRGTYGKPSPIDGGKYAREFMPWKRGQRLRKEIMQGVKEILEEHAEEE